MSVQVILSAGVSVKTGLTYGEGRDMREVMQEFLSVC